MASESVERFCQKAKNVTDDRQTDRQTTLRGNVSL